MHIDSITKVEKPFIYLLSSGLHYRVNVEEAFEVLGLNLDNYWAKGVLKDHMFAKVMVEDGELVWPRVIRRVKIRDFMLEYEFRLDGGVVEILLEEICRVEAN